MKITCKLSDLRLRNPRAFFSFEDIFNTGEFEVELTAEQVEQAYRERELEYRCEDARRHLFDYLYGTDGDSDNPLDEQTQKLIDGGALDPDSPNYLIDDIVNDYFDNFDCNVPENDQFENSIQRVLNSRLTA